VNIDFYCSYYKGQSDWSGFSTIIAD